MFTGATSGRQRLAAEIAGLEALTQNISDRLDRFDSAQPRAASITDA